MRVPSGRSGRPVPASEHIWLFPRVVLDAGYTQRKGEMFLKVHKIATGVLGRPFVVVTEHGVNTLLRFIHMISLANRAALLRFCRLWQNRKVKRIVRHFFFLSVSREDIYARYSR